MQYQNITGYKFIYLNQLEQLRNRFLESCHDLKLSGTILLSNEGINMSIAGKPHDILAFKYKLKKDQRFTDMSFRESVSVVQPFKRMKVKIKKEIITLRKSEANPCDRRAASIAPHILKQWLDQKKDFTLLDVRNEYEIALGTFQDATHLHLKHFCDFPKAVEKVGTAKPIVMFCTGGIRCEKAALYLMDRGYENIFQLEGGILNYFINVGKAHYQGECFVFDERVSVDA